MIPNKDDMLQHLFYLHSRNTSGLIQIRCIKPTRKGAQSESFKLNDIAQAIYYADDMNRHGFNIYVMVNPVKAGTVGSASDTDVATSFVQFVDADSIVNIGANQYQPSFVVQTGSVPFVRQHIYWMMDTATTDMRAYKNVQRGLAHRYDTDVTVSNPSRVARLAGSISYPDTLKSARGYITELTSFHLVSEDFIDRAAFTADLPVIVDCEKVQPERRSYEASSSDEQGDVPLEVLALLMQIIPPVNDRFSRSKWLSVGYAMKAANANSKHLFNEWQSRSLLYQHDDDDVWDSLHNADGFAILFSLAKEQDTYWFRHSPVVEQWWSKRIGAETTTSGLDRKVYRNMKHFKSNL